MTSRFKRYNNTKFDNLRALNSTLLNLSNSRSPEKLKRIMHFERNEMERRLNPEEFSSIITEFANNLSRRLTDFLTRNNFIFDQRLEEAIADIRHYVPIKVNTAVEELFGKYAGLLQSELKSYVGVFDDHMDLKMQEENDKQAQAELPQARTPKVQTPPVQANKNTISLVNPAATIKDLKDNQVLLEKFGFKINDTFDGLQIIDRSTSTSIPLYRFSSNVLVATDKSIELNIKAPGRFSIIKGSTVVNIEGPGISYGDKVNPVKSRIKFDENNNAHFYYCGEEQTDVRVIGIIMSKLEENFPYIHNEFMQIPSYASLHTEAEVKEKENSAFIKDENGNTKLNPQNRERYEEIIAACGLKMTEKDDGIYFAVEGQEQKAKGENFLTIDGVDGFFFNPNFYIVANQNISGPYFEMRTNNMSCVIPQDYSAINIFVGGVHYASRVDEAGNIKYYAHKGEDKICSPEEAKQFISELMPGVFNKNIEYSNSLLAPANTETAEEVKDLLDELEDSQNINVGVQMPEQEPDIDQELAKLMEDPNVQRYIELMNLKKQQEGYEAPSGPKM